MSELALPLWAALPAAVLLICGGLLAFIGSLGLLRMSKLLCAHASTDHGHNAWDRLRADRLDARVVGASSAARHSRAPDHGVRPHHLARERDDLDARGGVAHSGGRQPWRLSRQGRAIEKACRLLTARKRSM